MPESPYARIIDIVRTQCIRFGEALKIMGPKNKQNLPENCLKSTKMAITLCRFSKNFRGSMPPKPPTAVFVTLVA